MLHTIRAANGVGRALGGLLSVATLLSGLAVFAQSARAETAPALTEADVGAWMDGFLPYQLQKGDIAGAVVVVVKDGVVLFEKGYGYADVAARTPVDPKRTLFRPGSISKLFTWTAVMQLVEQGKLDLDRDINTYLDFTIPARDGKPITLRNLMTHTPGFEEVDKETMIRDPAQFPSLSSYVKTLLPARIFPPGEVPAYSNYATALAGYIIQRVSGQKFDDYIDAHVFAPLGMQNATFRQPLPARFEADMSKSYQRASGAPWYYELVGPAPAGSLAATGDDMARFMIAHLQNGRFGDQQILRPDTAQTMHNSALRLFPSLNSMMLGFYETNRNGRHVIGHGGDTQTFHSYLHLFLDEGVGLFISLNSTGTEGAAGLIRTALFNGFTDRYFPEATANVPTEQASGISAEHARLVAGTYATSRKSETNFMRIGGMLGQLQAIANPDGTLTLGTTLVGQPKQWRETAPFVWTEIGGQGRMAAKLVDGKVTALGGSGPYMVYQPVPWSRSASLIQPVAVAALAVLALTAIAWPITALVRRQYGARFALSGQRALAHRLVRIVAIFTLAYIVAWNLLLQNGMADNSNLTAAKDGWLYALQFAGLGVIAGIGVALWNGWLVWQSERGWWPRLRSVALVFAMVAICWVAFTLKLIGGNINY